VDAFRLGVDVQGLRPLRGDAPAHFDCLDAGGSLQQHGRTLGRPDVITRRKGEDMDQPGQDEFGLFKRQGISGAHLLAN